jgi:hypothetical protein
MKEIPYVSMESNIDTISYNKTTYISMDKMISMCQEISYVAKYIKLSYNNINFNGLN